MTGFERSSINTDMKILYIITRSELGGAQAVVLSYLQALDGQAEIALATGEDDFLAEQARLLGIPVFILPELVPPISPRLDCMALRSLYKLIRQYRPDLVHAHSSKAGLLGRMAARIAGVPSVFTAHGFAFTEGAGFSRRALAFPSEWLGARLGQSLIAVSEHDGNLAARFGILPRTKVNVIRNGIADVPFRARPSEGPRVNIAMVARFAPPKAHESVLHAMLGLQIDSKLWFIGEGPTFPRVRAEAIRIGLADRIEFMGARTDVPELLSQSHIFVLASNYEGLPISILEAMRAGLPVIASAVGGVPECVHDGITGFLVARGDIKALREKLRELIASPSLRTLMGQSGRELFETQFSSPIMIDKTIALYRATIEGCYKDRRTPRSPHMEEEVLKNLL